MIMLIKFFIPLLILNFNEQTSSREKIELSIELNYNNEKIVLNKAYQNNYKKSYYFKIIGFFNHLFIKIKHTFVCLILINEITQKFMFSCYRRYFIDFQ